jgi:transposase InsO family protein
MDIRQFDLNLLRTLDVLLHERNVTRAASRLQAASGALQRLPFYNPVRKHVRNGMLPPVEFERQQALMAQGV